jgi:hypothetical protein
VNQRSSGGDDDEDDDDEDDDEDDHEGNEVHLSIDALGLNKRYKMRIPFDARSHIGRDVLIKTTRQSTTFFF